MSYGVICQREGCRHYEESHDPEVEPMLDSRPNGNDAVYSRKCRAEWGPPGKRVSCECPGLILPADADEQRRFAKLMQEGH